MRAHTLRRTGLMLAGLLGVVGSIAHADLGAAEPELGRIDPGAMARAAATAETDVLDEDHDQMRIDREHFSGRQLRGGGTADNDATHYARGSTLIMHVFIDHQWGTWDATERAEAAAKATQAKQYYLDQAPAGANLSFDNEDGTAFWYVTTYVDSGLSIVEWDDVNAALASIGITDLDGDETLADEYSLSLQNWNGGWDNVILVCQSADATGRAWASYGTSVTVCYTDDGWQTWAHEWGHSFGSCDEYVEDGTCNGDIACGTCQSWYLDEDYDNGNCNLVACGITVDCLMLDNAETVCSFTNDHWSWDDDDGNGQLDWVARVDESYVTHDIMEVWNNGWFTHFTTTRSFAAHVTEPGWTVFGVRSPSGSDYDLTLFGDNNLRLPYASSAWGGTDVDFIVGDYNLNRTGIEHLGVERYAGSAQNYTLTWEGNGDVIHADGLPRSQNWTAENVVRVFDVPLLAGERVSFELDVTSGSLDVGMALFTSFGTTYFAGRSGALWSRDSFGAGGTEITEYEVPDDDVYGLVVWTNTAAAGEFTIKVGPTPATLQEASPAYSSYGLRLYNYDPVVPYWAVVGSRPDDGDEILLRLHDDAQYTSLEAISNEPGDELELIAINYADQPINRDHLRVGNPDPGSFRTEWEQGDDLSTGYIQGDWVSPGVAKAWDVYLEADQTYLFRQYHPMFIPVIDAGLYLFEPNRDATVSKAQAIAGSDQFTASQGGEYFLYTPDVTGFHGLAMVMNNEVSDGYSIWWGPRYVIQDDQMQTTSSEITYGISTVIASDWVVWGARPAPGDEVTAWCFGTDDTYASYEAYSGETGGVNLLVSDRNHLTSAEAVYTRFSRSAGTGPIDIEFEGGLGENLPYTEGGIETLDLEWADGDVVEGFDLFLDGDRGDPAYVQIQASVTSGDLDLGMAIFGSAESLQNYYQGFGEALAVANDHGDGEAERLELSTEISSIFGVVIWNENDGAGTYELTIVGSPILGADDVPGTPAALALRAGPNPLRGPARLSLDLPHPDTVSLTVYDVGGREVRTLVDEALPAGVHQLVWDGRDAGGEMTGPGVYLVRMVAGAGTRTAKLVRPGS